VPAAVLAWSLIPHDSADHDGRAVRDARSPAFATHLACGGAPALNPPIGIWLMSVFVREIPIS
jgi:hypothetical protein